MLIERLLRMAGYMAEAGDTAGGGGGADTVAAAGGADTVAGGTGADTTAGAKGADTVAGGKGGDTLLAQLGKDSSPGATGADTVAASDGADKLTPEQRTLAAAEKDTRRPKHVPPKYWDADKGEVKLEAWGKSTQQLEQRMRDVGLPPEAADGYKFEVPKPLKDAGVDLDPKMSKAFRDKAHSLGLTQKQYEGVMGVYFESMGAMADQTMTLSAEKAKTELLGFYKTEDALKANVRLAYKAFSAYADEKDMALIDSIGNIPSVIRVLAKIGKEMGEDPGVHIEDQSGATGMNSLEYVTRVDGPYWDAKHPQHAAYVQRALEIRNALVNARNRKAA